MKNHPLNVMFNNLNRGSRQKKVYNTAVMVEMANRIDISDS